MGPRDQTILQEAGGALHYTEISDRIIERGLKESVGPTPAATVAAIISQSRSKANTPYIKVRIGEYALKEIVEKPVSVHHKIPSLTSDFVEDKPETGALTSFGMFWRRDLVIWNGNPRLLGRQPGASEVNFSDQIGVYLLHDRDRVIYVGRAADALSARLKAHTLDRLGGRWDRFSWFGLKGVRDDGSLMNNHRSWDQSVVIETMEALLIESLEPPLNRKRGDNLSASEYLQVADPEIERNARRDILDRVQRAVLS